MMFEWFRTSLVFQYLSGKASGASVIPSAVYSYLRSILTAGRGVVVFLLDYDVREISSDVREILSTFSFYTTPVFYFILLPTYIFFLWFFSFFDAGGYSLEHPTLFHPSILTYGLFLRRGAGGGLFSLFCSHYYLPHHFSSQHFIGGRKWLT